MRYIHETALIGPNVTIEDDVYIGPYCVIGYPPEWKTKEDNDFGVLIKRGSRLTGMVTVDSGAERQTVIGEGCYLMKHSYVGHDCVLGNNVTMSPGAKTGGFCFIENGVNLGMNATVHQKITVPENCMIGANAFVGKKSVLRNGYKYVGVPVRELGPNTVKHNQKISVLLQYSTIDFRFLEANLRQVTKFSDDVIVTMCERFFNGAPENEERFDQSLAIMKKFKNVRLQVIAWDGIKDSTAYYHNLSRHTAYQIAKYDWVFFLDADEIVTDEFGEWFAENSDTDMTYVFNCNWYFRHPSNRAKQTESAGCLMRKSHCENWDLNNTLELKQFYQKLFDSGKIKHGDLTPILGKSGKPMVHHYSWVRSKYEMMQKVINWGHKNDRNWADLVTKEFETEFKGRDFVHNYEYEFVENDFNILTYDLK